MESLLETARNSPDEIDWDNISYNQDISEEFIREFQDRVNWVYISRSFRTRSLLSSRIK